MALRCPHCFEELERSEVAFRCAGTGGSCPPEEDIALAQHEGATRAPILPRVFKLPRRFSYRFGGPKGAVCRCGGRTTARVCPRCHSPWPPDYETTDNVLIAVVGEREVGKSTYLAVLLEEIAQHVAPRFSATFTHVDEGTHRHYVDELYRPIYLEKVPISPTSLRRPFPLIYRFRFEERRFINSVRVVTVVLYDTSGAHFGDSQSLAAYGACLATVEGIICLIDPLQIATVRPLATTDLLPDAVRDPVETVNRLDKMIRVARNVGPYGKVNIPVALTFSKADAIRAAFALGSVTRRMSLHQRFFDRSDGEHMDEAMRYHSSRWLGREFDQVVRRKFAQYTYLAISTLGDAWPDEFTPFRVEDPFLWLLSETDVIRSKRTMRQSYTDAKWTARP